MWFLGTFCPGVGRREWTLLPNDGVDPSGRENINFGTIQEIPTVPSFEQAKPRLSDCSWTDVV